MIPEVNTIDEQMINAAQIQRDARIGRINLRMKMTARKPDAVVPSRPQLIGAL
jgi:hypothetical protein